MKRKALAACMAAALLLTGCEPRRITDEDIAGTRNSWVAVGSVYSSHDGLLEGSMHSFSGVITLWTYDAPKDGEVEVTYKLSVENDKAMLVFVTGEGEFITILDNDGSYRQNSPDTMTLPVTPGKNRIRLVGSGHAKLEYLLSVDQGEVHYPDS